MWLLLLLPVAWGSTGLGARDAGAAEITYVYDELGRLVGVVDPAGDAVTYTYDAVGNLVSIGRQSSALVSIIEFTPNKGPVGTAVTISGTGFSSTPSQNTVTFTGTVAAVTSSTPTQIVTTVPVGASTGSIAVTAPAGSATSSTPFTVSSSGAPTITGFTPSIGHAGTAVSITGTNFDSAPATNRVKFNVGDGTVNTVTPTTINATVLASGTSGRISVATPAGQAVSAGDFFVPPPPHTASDVEVTGRMAIGASHVVTTTTAGKIGLIVFDGAAGQPLSMQMTNVTMTGLTEVRVYNPDGSIFTAFAFSGGAFIEPQPLPVTGTYTIRLVPGAGFSSVTGSVTLTLRDVQDATGTIAVDGPPVTVTTSEPGQNARVTFTGSAGQFVGLGMGSSTYLSSVTVALLKPDGTTLVSNTVGSGADLDAQLPVSGTYTIFVNPSGTTTGSVTFTLSSDLAGTIAINGAAVPVTTRSGQNTRLTFDGTAGQRVSLGVANSTFPCCIFVGILNPDGSTLASACPECGHDLDTQLPVTGTYTVLADPGNPAGSLTLTLSADITGPIVVNGPSVLATTRPGQNVRLTFDGTAGQPVSLGVTGSTYPCCIFVGILNPDGTTLVSACPECGHDLDTQLPVSGTYAVLVDPSNAAGSLTLALSTDIAGPIVLNGPSVNATTRSGQDIRLTFDGTIGQRVSLGVLNSTYPCCIFVGILNPDGTTLSSACPECAQDLDTQLPVTGTYTVLVDPKNPAGSLALTLSTDAGGPLALNDPAVPVTLRSGQNGRFTFDGTAGQRVGIGLTDSTFPCCSNVALLNPDGTTVASACTECGGEIVTQLPAVGTYTIVIDAGNAIGGVTMYLSSDVIGTLVIDDPPVAVTTRPAQNAGLTFVGTAGQQATVHVTDNAMCLTVTLLDPNEASLASSGFACGGTFNLATHTLATTGTYTVTVNASGDGAGSLNLSVTNP